MNSSDEDHQEEEVEQVASGDDADTERESDLSSDEEDWECDDDDYIPVVRVPLFQRAARRLLDDERAGPPRVPVQVSNSPQEVQDPGIELAAEVEARENVLNDAFLADSQGDSDQFQDRDASSPDNIQFLDATPEKRPMFSLRTLTTVNVGKRPSYHGDGASPSKRMRGIGGICSAVDPAVDPAADPAADSSDPEDIYAPSPSKGPRKRGIASLGPPVDPSDSDSDWVPESERRARAREPERPRATEPERHLQWADVLALVHVLRVVLLDVLLVFLSTRRTKAPLKLQRSLPWFLEVVLFKTRLL